MLYIARREFEQSNDNTYVVSMSSRTIVYKGMFLVGQLRTFFADLQNPDYESAIAMVHSRFSTNTNPSWERAHPNRFMVHNGEINTIRGNADKMLAREENMESPYLKGQLHKVLPVSYVRLTSIDVQLRTSEHRSMYSYVRLSIDHVQYDSTDRTPT